MQLVVRTGLWVALALGCVGGAVALLRPAGGSETPAADPAAAGWIVPAPAAGVAEKTVERWLKATDEQRDELVGMFVEPPISAQDADTDGLGGTGLDVRRVTTVAGKRLQDGYWSVTVAVDLMVATGTDATDGGATEAGTTDTTAPTDQSTTTTDPVTGAPAVEGDTAHESVTWFFELGIVAVDDDRYLALAAPSLVPAPSTGTAAWTVSGDRAAPEPGDPMADLVQKFLAALLAGGGDPAPYLAPGAEVPDAQGTPPFADLSVVELATKDLGDGQTWVLAHVVATTPEGAHLPLTYDLVVVERVDRWEVVKLSGVPTLIE